MITQKITCDHCGVTLGESERDLCIARVTIGGAPIDDVHGCRDYHLALGTAKALGLDISPKIADLRAQLDAANAKIASLETAAKMHEAALSRMPANEVKRDYLHPISGAELLRRIERMPPEALLDADEHADGGTNSEREQYEITIEKLNARIADISEDLKREKENHFLAREEIRGARDRIAELETSMGELTADFATMTHTTERLTASLKRLFAAIGYTQGDVEKEECVDVAVSEVERLWRIVREGESVRAPIDANGKTPAEVFVERYEQRRNKGVTWDRYSEFDRALISHGCNAVLAAFGPGIAAKALAELRAARGEFLA